MYMHAAQLNYGSQRGFSYLPVLASFFCVERWKEVNDVGCHRVSNKQAKFQPPERCVTLFCNLNLMTNHAVWNPL